MTSLPLVVRGFGAAYSRLPTQRIVGDRLTVLIYHRVHRKHDAFSRGGVDAATFDWQLKLLARHFNVLPLGSAVAALHGGESLPRGAVAISFDDGYRDNYEIALPILTKYGLTATFFIATGFLDGGIMWNDVIIECLRRTEVANLNLDWLGLGKPAMVTASDRDVLARNIIKRVKHEPADLRRSHVSRLIEATMVDPPDDLMMSSSHVRAMVDAGMEIGAHTVSHPILRNCDSNSAREEIQESRSVLERITNDAVRGFAYPNGRPGEDFSERDVRLVEELGFDYAVSTRWDIADRGSDRFAIPRINPWDETPLRWMVRVIAARALA